MIDTSYLYDHKLNIRNQHLVWNYELFYNKIVYKRVKWDSEV